jgi:hypothetical protein
MLVCVTVFALAFALLHAYGPAGFIAAAMIGVGAGGLTLVGRRRDIRRVVISIACTVGFGLLLAALLLPAHAARPGPGIPQSWTVAFCVFGGWAIGGFFNAMCRPKPTTRDLVSPLLLARPNRLGEPDHSTLKQ